MSIHTSRRKPTNLHLLLITLTLTLTLTLAVSAQSRSSPNQQIIIDFDGDQESLSPHPSKASPDSPAEPNLNQPTARLTETPAPTGLAANMIKKFTGWNDSVVAKLTGQIPPRPPHPFVHPITDDNFDSVIESDLDLIQPGWGSDDDTVWVVSVVATDRSSNLFEEEFDQLASNSSLSTQPIPPKKREDEIDLIRKEPNDPYLFKKDIRFGRIDYMGKTDMILTKWLIFKCPVMVIITKRGSEVRFFKTGAVPPKAELLGEFLREGRWVHKPVWDSTFSRGNSGEWILKLMGKIFKGFHDLTDKVPGWVLMIVSSMIGTSLMQWLHVSGSKFTSTPTPSNTTGASKNQSGPNPAASDDVHPEQLASPELKQNLAQAAAQLAQITDQKLGNQSVQRRKK